MSVEVPTVERVAHLEDILAALQTTVKDLIAQVAAIPEQIQLTPEEQAALQTVIALINRLAGGT